MLELLVKLSDAFIEDGQASSLREPHTDDILAATEPQHGTHHVDQNNLDSRRMMLVRYVLTRPIGHGSTSRARSEHPNVNMNSHGR